MNRRHLILMAAGGSALLLGGAFLFQSLGYAPCTMCLWQRWPHAIAIVLGVVGYLWPRAVVAVLGALAAFATAAIGVFHAGVEWKFWPGPSSCTGGGSSLSGLSGSDLLSTDIPETLVMCDEIVWQLFGLSMAGWNALLSFALVALWIAAATRPAR
ncbi:disulfide bond formation protein B [Oceaniglobus trochenteri]|uniref:disulfide bond formation protein B n=1 Tax=Oceaniglobus trochenteri TaxID=2763260 RepID=UPI001CFFE1E9|nr:disulfide bond formation protein B [Oceaniglobus trochenteri]